MNIRYNEAVVDEPEEEIEDDYLDCIDNICQYCAGTGEGRSEYDSCRSCHGSGCSPKKELEDWSYLYD
jgi:hypothetical protein